MFMNPMSPEMVRIVHERQIHEAAVRRSHLALAESAAGRSAMRRVVGAALIRAGRAIASESPPICQEVECRPVVSGC